MIVQQNYFQICTKVLQENRFFHVFFDEILNELAFVILLKINTILNIKTTRTKTEFLKVTQLLRTSVVDERVIFLFFILIEIKQHFQKITFYHKKNCFENIVLITYV